MKPKKKTKKKTGKKNTGKRKSPTKKAFSSILPNEGFVRLPVVLAVLGIGKTSFYLGVGTEGIRSLSNSAPALQHGASRTSAPS